MNSFDARYMELRITKLEAILNKEKTAVEVSEELAVTRQTVHRWLCRYKRFGRDGLITRRKKHREGRVYNKTPEVVERLVLQTADEYWKDGVETLADRLQLLYNLTLHPSTVFRILRRKGSRYVEGYSATQKRTAKKLYFLPIPGMELQVDTFYPYGYKMGKVIYTAIDDATRWVYVYSYETANARNTRDFLEKLIRHAPFPLQKIRTDQGKEFIAHAVEDFLHEHGIVHRRNTPYSPEENGKIERFHRTLSDKGICMGFYPDDTLDEMQYKLTLFLHYYNHRKKHRGLGMNRMTPMEKLLSFTQGNMGVTLQLQCYKYVFLSRP